MPRKPDEPSCPDWSTLAPCLTQSSGPCWNTTFSVLDQTELAVLPSKIHLFFFKYSFNIITNFPSQEDLSVPHITFFKSSSHCWFQFTWFGCQRPYFIWFTLLMVIPWLNIHQIIRNILEIIPCAVETDVFSSVPFGWNVLHNCVWFTGLYCRLRFLFLQ